MKRSKSLLIAAASVAALCSQGEPKQAAAASGPKTSASTHAAYRMKHILNKSVNTFEAWIKLPSSLSSEVPGGIIAGSFFNTAEGFSGATDFAIGRGGSFDVFWNYTGMVSQKPTFEAKFTFSSVDLRNDRWTHIAFVRDIAGSSVHYYVDGELKETQSIALSDAVTTYPFGFGVDWANWYIDLYDRERSPFQGELSQVLFDEGSLSASEIASDKEGMTHNDRPTIIGNWLFQQKEAESTWGDEEEIRDLSNKGENLELVSWNNYVDVKDTGEFDYSIAVIPDQQAMCYAPLGKRYMWTSQSKWLLNNKEKEKIAFVSYVGDMTESNSVSDPISSTEEFQFASSCIRMLDGKIPYTNVLGNHDYDNWLRTSRGTTQYNTAFPYDSYFGKPGFEYMVEAFEEGKMDNYYSVIPAGNVEYMIFSLEEAPRDIVLNWVNRRIEENPTKRVILTTHSYMSPNKSIVGPNSTYAPSKTIKYESPVNDGILMWEKSVSKYPNVFAVFCGHECTDEIVYRADKGKYGNTVHQILVDAQGSVLTCCMNTFLLIKVNEVKKTMSFCYYYPEFDACFLKQNQFTVSFADKFNPAVR